MIADPYKVLGISPDATDQDLKKAYREMSKKYHPDANPDDPEAAEERFKNVQEAYRQITEARERGTSAYGTGQQTSYGSSSGTGRGYAEYDDPFSAFQDFFTQWQNSSAGYGSAGQSSQRQSSSESNAVRAAVNYINAGYYKEALTALAGEDVRNRNAQWYYVSAIANRGAGNNMTAIEHAKRAVDMEPTNAQYTQLLNRLQNGGMQYQQRGATYQPMSFNTGWCLSMLALNMFCSCCGRGF